MSPQAAYKKGLEKNFGEYRRLRFRGQDQLFEARPDGGPVVFNRQNRERNLLIPPCNPAERDRIVAKIAKVRQHKHFGSMLSSQALTQSIFGTFEVLNRLPLLSGVKAEDGSPAFGQMLCQTKLYLEKEVRTLGERPTRTTSIDVWFEGTYRVAVECKLAEISFGNCSRPRRKPEDGEYCDGNYVRQKERTERCALTEIGVLYWSYVADLFGLSSDTDHRPCPLYKIYQLTRNVLAACVDERGEYQIDHGHALIIYDQRNPAMAKGGLCDLAWRAAHGTLRDSSRLRRLSWQAFVAQWPSDEKLDWLKAEMGTKYGIV
jgi:hypothetical protein